jgi:SAM-dependent methyltransferase
MGNDGVPGSREILTLYPRLTRTRKILLATRFASIPYRFLNTMIPENAVVFELGCGQGILANFLKEAAPQRVVVGMDLSESRIGVARSSIDDRTGIYFLVGDVAQLPVSGRASAPDRPHIYITSQVLYLLPEEAAVTVMRSIGRRLRQQDV